MRQHAVILLLAIAACTDNTGGGGGGSDVTTHVLQLEFPAATNLYCFDQALADVDATTPGPQYECSVSDVVSGETLLPLCNNGSTNKPCWLIEPDLANCPNGDHLSMTIARSGAPPADAKVMAQCVATGA